MLFNECSRVAFFVCRISIFFSYSVVDAFNLAGDVWSPYPRHKAWEKKGQGARGKEEMGFGAVDGSLTRLNVGHRTFDIALLKREIKKRRLWMLIISELKSIERQRVVC